MGRWTRFVLRHRRAVLLATHMPPDARARCGRKLAGEMSDPARRAIDQHLAPEQQPALPQRVQGGQPRNR